MSVSNWLTRMRGPRHFLNRADEFLDLGQSDLAMEQIEVAQELGGDSDNLRWYFAKYYFAKNDIPRAFEFLRTGGISGPETSDGFFKRGKLIEEQGDFDRALELYQLVVENRSGDERARAHFLRARLFRFRLRTREMMEEVFLSLESGDCGDVYSMFFGLNSEEERLEMLRHLPRILDLHRKPGRLRVALNLTIATIHCKNRDFDTAAKYVAKARSLRIWRNRLFGVGRSRGPDFFIIGTAKSGTTSLYASLTRHPNVVSAVRKELHYFYNPDATEEWYLAHFPNIPAGSQRITGEATPNYYAYPIQEEIKKRFPNAKMIFLMRDPAKRAVSQYFHSRRHGTGAALPIEEFFRLESISELLKRSDDEIEEQLFTRGNNHTNSMVSYSLYYYFLRRWFRHFDRSQILLLRLEDLQQDQHSVLNQVYRHLGVHEMERQGFEHHYRGNYKVQAPEIQSVLSRLDEFYETPNRKLLDEFGIDFSKS